MLENGTNLEHDFDSTPADLVRDCLELRVGTVSTAKARVDQRGAVGDEQVPDTLLSDSGDLDELGEAIADLGGRERLEESKIEEGGERGMVRAQPAADMILCQIERLE
jgi:hypothetical protein